MTDADLDILKQIKNSEEKITEVLSNNFRTQDAFTHYFNLITEINKYFSDIQKIN